MATPCERLPGRGAAAAPIARAERTADAPEGVRGETAGPAGRASWPRCPSRMPLDDIVTILWAAETRRVAACLHLTEEGWIPTWRRAGGFDTNKQRGCRRRHSFARRRAKDYREGCAFILDAQTTVLPQWQQRGTRSILTVPHPRRGGLFLRQAPLARENRSTCTCEDLPMPQKYHGEVVAMV